MGTLKSRKSVHSRVSTTLERLERLMGQDNPAECDHPDPETVEDSVRRLKGRLPGKPPTPQDG